MKDSSVELLFKGIRAVMAGEYWVGRERVADLTQYFRAAPRDAHATKQTFGLTPRERMVFELRHYQGLRLRRIGEILGASEEAAKNCLFRANQKMRSALGDFV